MNDNIDFDINNYTFNDILKLFKLNPDYDNSQLLRAKNIVEQLHPDNSKFDRQYYDLFFQMQA